jgi:hypothetical protein
MTPERSSSPCARASLGHARSSLRGPRRRLPRSLSSMVRRPRSCARFLPSRTRFRRTRPRKPGSQSRGGTSRLRAPGPRPGSFASRGSRRGVRGQPARLSGTRVKLRQHFGISRASPGTQGFNLHAGVRQPQTGVERRAAQPAIGGSPASTETLLDGHRYSSKAGSGSLPFGNHNANGECRPVPARRTR